MKAFDWLLLKLTGRDRANERAFPLGHPFQPSYHDPAQCSWITEGLTWTASDPHRCRKSQAEHLSASPAASEPTR